MSESLIRSAGSRKSEGCLHGSVVFYGFANAIPSFQKFPSQGSTMNVVGVIFGTKDNDAETA
jgi:hypothetical protein